MKHRLNDLTHVLRRSVEIATHSGPVRKISMFKEFEKKVLSILIGDLLAIETLERIHNSKNAIYKFTGVGYYLDVKDDGLPQERIVLDKPLIKATGAGVEVGFVVFIENGELTLECHGWDGDIPEKFREAQITIETTRA